MSLTGSTLFTDPEPPTVPRLEWPCTVRTAAVVAPAATTGRRGYRDGEDVWPAAVLVNSGTYVGKAVHAKPREPR